MKVKYSNEAVENIASRFIEKYAQDSHQSLKESTFRDNETSFVSNDVVSMEAHNESYTNILKAYSEELEGNIRFKNKCKGCFFVRWSNGQYLHCFDCSIRDYNLYDF